MSYLYVGVGGSGAKLMQSLVHLSAAGLLPEGGRELMGFLIDPDQSNGSVTECAQVAKLYERCKKLAFGSKTDLFKNKVSIRGPWSPISDVDVATLDSIFDLTRMRRVSPDEADLMELLFSPEEREMPVLQGFRGRPSIGAAILDRTVSFDDPIWSELRNRALNARAHADVSLLLAGSVFGGSGAAGVPTMCRLLRENLGEAVQNLRIGLILLLPYFTYRKVEDEPLQADPQEFAIATAEALKYYDERHFLSVCKAIYAVGEHYPALMPVPAVGSKEQRNPPHFVELVAALGAIRFMRGDGASDENGESVVSLAGRGQENTLRWADLPTATNMHNVQMALLQQFTLFAVSYHYVLFPQAMKELHSKGPIADHLRDTSRDQAGQDLKAVDDYLQTYLSWLLSISTPEREEGGPFIPGLVEVDVFGVKDGQTWRLKSDSEFSERHLEKLFLNLEERGKPRLRAIFHAATADVNDDQARGAGKMVRAIYDACKLQ